MERCREQHFYGETFHSWPVYQKSINREHFVSLMVRLVVPRSFRLKKLNKVVSGRVL